MVSTPHLRDTSGTMPARTITTTAIGRRKAPPELATVEVTAIGTGDSAAVARETARDRAATIREAVTAVSTTQIQTVTLRVEDSSNMFDAVTDAQYQAKERLQVDCVPETAKAVVVEVTDAGGTVQAVQFALSETVHRQLQNEALTAAMERAREKAERLAAAEGVAVAGIQHVTTTEESTAMESIVDEALASNPQSNLQPTPVAVSEAVEVTYELVEECCE